MTYYNQLTKETLQAYQKKSQKIRNEKHLRRCKEAYIIFSENNSIQDVCEQLGVKVVQAYRLVKKGRDVR